MRSTDQLEGNVGFYLNHLVLVHENELVLFLSEERISDETKELTFNEGSENFLSLKGNLIVTDETSKKYKVTFKRFFAYQVVDETSIEGNDNEVFRGAFPRKFSESRFLSHIKQNLNVEWYDEVPEMNYEHFQFAYSNFVVDIASHEPPLIEEVNSFNVQ